MTYKRLPVGGAAVPPVKYRQADLADIPAAARLRDGRDEEGGASADRMARYLACRHHPQQALMPRTIYVALEDDSIVGYIAGHLTRRYECDGELQWVYVAPECRRSGTASELLRLLAAWFVRQGASRVCVNVDPNNMPARRFYARHGAAPLNEHWLVWNDINDLGSDRLISRIA
ncbi:MAG: GNAT family N-acetyltransferase [Armatimonadetes bacterium]|nr:GNAT family N-acetyltransferase [Armatimonadota bacterium]